MVIRVKRQQKFLLLLAFVSVLIWVLAIQIAALFAWVRSSAQQLPPDPRFGVVEAFWDTAAAIEAGVAWERILFQWSQLQPNGPGDWNTLHVPDEWLAWARAQGREVVGLLKNTPHWATDADPPLEASLPRGLDAPVEDPANTWATFVRRVATFYGPRGVHRWIIWNEPDIPPGVFGQEWAGGIEAYYRLLKVAYLAIKEVDPDARIHLAGLTFWHDRDWLRRFLAVASADPEGPAHEFFFDVVSLHIYFQTDTVDFIINEARAALSAYGLNKPIWINETNASPDADPQWPIERPRWRVDLREQASFILQAYALGLAAGAERVGVYKFMDIALPPGGEPFGLLRPDHSRRPAYDAYRLLTQYYAGTREARIYRQPLSAQVSLHRGERTTRVLWARTATPVSLTLPSLASQATLVDQEGNLQLLEAISGDYVLHLPGARCADEVAGCIIGGPTFLLVEDAPGGNLDPPRMDVTAPAQEDTEEAVTPSVEGDGTPTETPTNRPAPPVVTSIFSATLSSTSVSSATATATMSPSPPPSATPTMTPIPSSTSTAAIRAGGTPSLTEALLPSVTPTPLPGSPADRLAPLAAPGLTVLIGLSGYVLWRVGRRSARRS